MPLVCMSLFEFSAYFHRSCRDRDGRKDGGGGTPNGGGSGGGSKPAAAEEDDMSSSLLDMDPSNLYAQVRETSLFLGGSATSTSTIDLGVISCVAFGILYAFFLLPNRDINASHGNPPHDYYVNIHERILF